MRILAFTHIYPSLQDPTRGPYHLQIFRALAERAEVRVVSPQAAWSRLRQPGMLLQTPRETQTGLETLLPTYWSVPKFTTLHAKGMYRSAKPVLQRLRKEFPFDVIFSAWAYPDIVAASWLARDFGCPVIGKVLGSDINSTAQNPTLQPQIVAGLRQVGRIVTVSGALRDRVIELGIDPARVVVQHNGVNGSIFTLRERAAVCAELKISPTAPTLCYVGRLSHEKGVDVLIAALGVLKAQGRSDIQLYLVGGGPEEEALRAQASQLGVAEQVHFLGMRPHDEVPLWISACHVLCLPSRREGCPNVVLEALASGRPVVASRVGGVPELLCDQENGLMVPSETPPALAQALTDALARPWSPEALRQSVGYLSWEAVGARYYEILEAVLREQTP